MAAVNLALAGTLAARVQDARGKFLLSQIPIKWSDLNISHGGGGGGGTLAADWTARSTAAGVVKTQLFDTSAKVTNNVHQDGNQANVVWDANDGIMGAGCLRCNHFAADGANAGAWRAPLNNSWTTDGQGPGSSDIYIQFRLKLGPNRLVPTPNSSGPGEGGFKFVNISEYLFSSPNSSRSHAGNEIVANNQFWYGMPQAYRACDYRDPDLFGVPNNGGGKLQNAIDHGAGVSDPDARYCNYVSGLPGSAGCWRFNEGEWMTIYIHFKCVFAGGAETSGANAGNIFEMWVARDGETSYTQLYNIRDQAFGTDSGLPNFVNGIWFLTYDTNRINATYDTWQKYDQLIVSTQPIACPQVGTQPTWLSTMGSLLTGKALTGSNVNAAQTYAQVAGLSKDAIFSYSGATKDRRSMYFMGGGHADSAENTVLKLDLSANAPATAVLRTPTTSVTGDVGYYGDGRPVSRHSCWNIQYVETRNRLFFPGAPASYNQANLKTQMDGFNLATNDYDAAGTWSISGMTPTNVGSGCCKDGQDNILYWDSDNGPLRKWTQASASSSAGWSTLNGSSSSSNYGVPICYDPVNHRVVRFSSMWPAYIDLATNVEHAIASFGALPDSGLSVEWCPDMQCFLALLWYSRTVYKITVTGGTYTVSTLTLSSWTAPFLTDGDGKGWVLGRWAYMADYGVMLYVHRTGDDAWVFRTR